MPPKKGAAKAGGDKKDADKKEKGGSGGTAVKVSDVAMRKCVKIRCEKASKIFFLTQGDFSPRIASLQSVFVRSIG